MKCNFSHPFFFLLLVLFTQSAFGQTSTLVIQSGAVEGKDAFVYSYNGNTTTNYGQSPSLPVYAWTHSGIPALSRSFFQFPLDQLPDGAEIVSSTLTLYHYAYDDAGLSGHSQLSGSNASVIQRVTSSWDESTINWANQPSVTTTNQVSVPASTSATQDFVIDVTQLVEDAITNDDNSVGFSMKLVTESYYRALTFASSDNSDSTLWPKLEIEYNCPFTVNPITGNSTVCADQYLPLSNTTTGGVWSSSNTSVATVNNGWVTGAAAGTSTISYAVTSNGCTETVTKDITVNDKLSFSIVGPSTVCPNTSGNAYTVSPTVSGADYTWNIQDGPNVGVNFPVNGSTNTELSIPNSVANNQFTLRCQGLNACGASEIVSKVISLNTDVPPAPDVTCSGTSGTNECVNLVVTNYGSNSIEWIVGGVVQSTSATFTRPLGTAVLCTYTSASGCTKSTWYSPEVVCTYAARLNNSRLNNSSTDNSQPASTDNEFTLFPNPNNGTFTLTTNGYNGRALILNMLGVVVEEIQVNENSNTYNIQMTDKPKGSYIIKLTGGNKDHVSLFIVQ